MHAYGNQLKMVTGTKYFGCIEILLHYFINMCRSKMVTEN